MAKTLQDQYSAAFSRLGAKEIKRTSKYIVFQFGANCYYLGKSGALRKGKNIKDSIPTTGDFRERLLSGHITA